MEPKDVIIKPHITEKATQQTETFSNRYTFIVNPKATKYDIKKAVEWLYNVKVEKVNTANFQGKKKLRGTRTGWIEGRTPAFKKATVFLKEGYSIDFYSNI